MPARWAPGSTYRPSSQVGVRLAKPTIAPSDSATQTSRSDRSQVPTQARTSSGGWIPGGIAAAGAGREVDLRDRRQVGGRGRPQRRVSAHLG